MIFTELVLHNYGVYLGRCSIDLTPASPERPIVLVGGLNGGGKTTILDAIRLALYGQRADLSNRGDQGWNDYLRSTINREAPQSQGAGVELELIMEDGLDATTYRIVRTWTAKGSGASEHLQVFVDGSLDRVLTDSWADRIEEVLPADMAGLFLFDGEKIEALADSATAAKVVKSGIDSLLGTGVLARLRRDLSALERRTRQSLLKLTDEDKAKLSELKARSEQAQQDLADGDKLLKAARRRHTSTQRKAKAAVRAFEKAGAVDPTERFRLDAERNTALAQLADAEQTMISIAHGALPLCIVSNRLASVKTATDSEHEAKQRETLVAALVERDSAVADELRRSGVAKKTIDLVNSTLKLDRAERQPEPVDQQYRLDEKTRTMINVLTMSTLGEASQKGRQALDVLAERRERLDDADRRLAQLPANDAVADVMKKKHTTEIDAQKAELQLDRAISDFEKLERDCERNERLVQREEERLAEEALDSDRGQRLILFSSRSRDTIEQLEGRLVLKHVQRIGDEIGACLKQLLRKPDLVDKVTIDEDTFNLELTNASSKTIPADRLSAGERQLLATSTLWGLGRSSSRPIPLVIDTPLGRLDSVHRNLLVEHYFPHASHQVVLLSTDEEIDAELHERLAPHIGRSYCVSYNETTSASTISPGYFWEGGKRVA